MASNSPEDKFTVIFTDNTPIVYIPPRLSVLEAVDFKTQYQQLLEDQPQTERIILDFTATQFMDSSGVGALVSNLKATTEQGAQLVLRNVRPPVRAVLAMTSLDKVLTIEAESRPEGAPPPVVNHGLPPETHPSVRSWLKRSMDIVGGLVGLSITAILFVPIAIAIKRDSPGPILFGQVRCGWMGRRFRIWKFRSMCTDAERLKRQVQNQASGAFFKNDNDPRVTTVGRFLRRTSLDELPQFLNVVRGEMSLVGTRPPTPEEVEAYQIPEWQRLDVKPGMTGEWQVNGRSSIRNFEDVIKLDLRYQSQWSLWYDVKLIIRTVLILFNKKSGAV
ncbi:anti-sigma factor antagonist [Spirulina major]|uniref:anti-sigma factor antagonist n=1 Tax=Spirulina major TaxID=270636 RepID=UPI00093284F3|nr:anti-sigma factor antagonist [Spirulina major]